MATTSAVMQSRVAEIARIDTMRWVGRVTDVVGVSVVSHGPQVAVGDFCEIRTAAGRRIRTQVIGFRDGRVLSMPLEEPEGLTLGDAIVARSEDARIQVGPDLLGRVIDGFGNPLDGGPAVAGDSRYDLFAAPRNPMDREHIVERLSTGVRAIDGLLPCGRGQRIGVFGGSGVGKSTLLAAMARGSAADVNVIAMIGERNREVRAFLDHELGPEGARKSVVVVATSDRPAPLRVRACFVALAVAEYFSDQGKSVLLVMDSVTRLAMAQREIGLAAGEPPSQKGYTPSVFSMLPRIFERAGNFATGSITGFFTVLVEGDDFTEPICDATRGILDGHIILSRELAGAGHYPAIDIEQSISRLSSKIASREQLNAAMKIRDAWSSYRRAQDLIHLGAYTQGSDAKLDASIAARDRMLAFLGQDAGSYSPIDETLSSLDSIAAVL
ncbi:MAG TPA: FliI/YscN family ATPase, partial [Sinorhizobium sp.]|nr:FliI/YscN family ATPase [Sinorhizobium sp.]